MSTYRYYNPNPDAHEGKKWHKNDCAVRAFACLLNKTWSETYKGLCETGLKKFDMPNAPKVIEQYAKDNGYTKVSLDRYMTLKEFAKTHNTGRYLCNVYSHVVCVRDGEIWDAWDCSNYKLKTYYTKSR